MDPDVHCQKKAKKLNHSLTPFKLCSQVCLILMAQYFTQFDFVDWMQLWPRPATCTTLSIGDLEI